MFVQNILKHNTTRSGDWGIRVSKPKYGEARGIWEEKVLKDVEWNC